jgi:hypothetical protein
VQQEAPRHQTGIDPQWLFSAQPAVWSIIAACPAKKTSLDSLMPQPLSAFASGLLLLLPPPPPSHAVHIPRT